MTASTAPSTAAQVPAPTASRRVSLVLVHGKSTALITAEIMNRTDHILTGPRADLPQLLSRPEAERTMSRNLRAHGQVNHRGRARPPKRRPKPTT